MVAELDGRLVGMGGMGGTRPNSAGHAEVLRIRVRPAVRRRGVGRALTATLEQRAAHLGMRETHLDTATNQPEAMAFYEGFGYREIGREHRPELVVDARVLRQGAVNQFDLGLLKMWWA